MMKVAVACDNGMVTGHFGHCREFVIFETENKQILSETPIANPGHRPGYLPNFLHEQGVNVIVSGGMGGAAVDIFNSHNIEVIIGTQGTARNAVEKYLAGELKSTGSVCHHEHDEDCDK